MDSNFFLLLFSSAVAAFISRLVTHPLETVKIRIQSGTLANVNPLAALYLIITNEGWRSLFSGITIALTFSIPALTTYITSYDYLKPFIAHLFGLSVTNAIVHLISGALSETISAVFWTPMEVIKARLQTSNSSVSTASMIRSIYNAEGIAGFYRGYFLGIAVYVPHSIVFFIVFEQLKMLFSKTLFDPSQPLEIDQSLPVWAVLVSSMIAAACAGAVSNFVDVIKTKWQIAGKVLTERKHKVADSGNQPLLSDDDLSQQHISVIVNEEATDIVVEDEGLTLEEQVELSLDESSGPHLFQMIKLMWIDGEFFVGMWARVVWIVPSITLFFCIDEYLKSILIT
ncbi:hypothetical protein HK098_005105 [Nowakowskiella sp. JEL0407]|nr:hypothetical protein HK098_005105 [Nowakowskiella sp. JEL0407]